MVWLGGGITWLPIIKAQKAIRWISLSLVVSAVFVCVKAAGSFVGWVLLCVCLAPSTMAWKTHFSALLSHRLWTPRLVGLINVTDRCARNLPPLFISVFLSSSLYPTCLVSFILPFSSSDLWSISDLFSLNDLSFGMIYVCVCVCVREHKMWVW